MARLNQLGIAVVLFAGAAVCGSQELQTIPARPGKADAAAPRGSVTGTVYCADTNAPARLARVKLVQVSGGTPGQTQNAVTDLEGRFAIGRVPEGKYYVSAAYSGYLNPLANFDVSRVAAMSADARKEFESRLTIVAVSGNKPAEAAVRLERAGEIDGVVLYDDGSPAVQLHVDIKAKTGGNAGRDQTGGLNSFVVREIEYDRTTDDRGRFRILGVAPGEYLVSVVVPTASADSADSNPFIGMIASSGVGSLAVYQGGALRASKAKPVKIGTGSETADVEITIPLSSLHTIHGHVVLKSTGQPPLSAGILLLYADTREVARITVSADGEFKFAYVPEDNYIVQALGSGEAFPKATMEDEDSSILFSKSDLELDPDEMKHAAEVPLLVAGDVEDVTVAVPDPATQKPEQSAESENENGLQTVVPE